jgi:hypothetical protein
MYTFLNDIVLVTYTNSRYADVWPIHFGQLDELLPEMKSYVISDVVPNSFFHHKFIQYKNSDWYWKQWCDSLTQIACKYFIYLQEDFFLYGRPDLSCIQYCLCFLDCHPELSFIRLCAHDRLPKDKIESNLFDLPAGNQFVFAMQPTIWRKDTFLALYKEVASDDFREKQAYVDATVKLRISGVYVYQGESKRGFFHYNSNIFPYTATGLVRRKWNTLEYQKELKELTTKYKIDMSIRGFFDPNEPQEW